MRETCSFHPVIIQYNLKTHSWCRVMIKIQNISRVLSTRVSTFELEAFMLELSYKPCTFGTCWRHALDSLGITSGYCLAFSGIYKTPPYGSKNKYTGSRY